MILSEEQLLIQESARKFAQERLAPHSAEWEEKAAFPPGIFKELGALGFMGMTVPPEWGGAGADNVAYSLALMEIAAGDGALATVVSGHNSVGVMPILNYGTEAQKTRYVRDLATGAKLSAFALTEPQGGSDAASIRTRATRKGDAYVLNGTKQFITSGQTRGHRARHCRHRPGRRQARHLGLHRRHQDARLRGGARREENGPERLGHLRDPAGGRGRPGGGPAGRGGPGLSHRARQPGGWAHRHRLAVRGHGARRARGRRALRARAPRLRQDHLRAPGGVVPAGRHGHQPGGGAPAHAACGGAEGCRPALPDRGLDGQAVRLGGGGAHLLGCVADAGRRRLHPATSGWSASAAACAAPRSTRAPTTSSGW